MNLCKIVAYFEVTFLLKFLGFERQYRKDVDNILKAKQNDINYTLTATQNEMQPFAKCGITLQVIHLQAVGNNKRQIGLLNGNGTD